MHRWLLWSQGKLSSSEIINVASLQGVWKILPDFVLFSIVSNKDDWGQRRLQGPEKAPLPILALHLAPQHLSAQPHSKYCRRVWLRICVLRKYWKQESTLQCVLQSLDNILNLRSGNIFRTPCNIFPMRQKGQLIKTSQKGAVLSSSKNNKK